MVLRMDNGGICLSYMGPKNGYQYVVNNNILHVLICHIYSYMSYILYDNMSYYSLIYIITSVNIIVCDRYIYGLIKQVKAGSESDLLFGYPMLMYMLTQNDPNPYLTFFC